MLNFTDISVDDFLTHYWQKKPLIMRNALKGFMNPIDPDTLAGLAMEEEIESRLVFETPGLSPPWSLKQGPFSESDFKSLPKTHWTLLVQGVDRFIPEVADLLDNFNFLPQWRVDDVMISYAVEQGGVGPHYDNYDVFLYQAKGRRKWLLTTKDCHENNYHSDVLLRIMKSFQIEQEFILEEGDMLYLPPHVGHHGISLSGDCMTYSFGFRSYQSQELWDSFAEFLAENSSKPLLYKDPNWLPVSGTSLLPRDAWLKAKECMQTILDDEVMLKSWFASFATSLDQQAESILPDGSLEEDTIDLDEFKKELLTSQGIVRNPVCRFAYMIEEDTGVYSLYINGCEWNVEKVSIEFVKLLADKRTLLINELLPFMDKQENEIFLFDLWKLQWIEFLEISSQ